MRSFWQLLRKDTPCWLALGCIGNLSFCLALLDAGFARLWIDLPLRVGGLHHTSWIVGLVVGVTVVSTDWATRTSDYLRHRPVSSARIHAARLVGAAIVLAACFVVPPIVSFGLETISPSGQTSLGHMDHLGAIWAYQVPTLSAAALGAFALGAPLHPALRVCVTAAGILVLLGGGNAIAWDGRGHDPSAYVAFHLLAAALLCAASFCAGSRRYDADRSPTRATWPTIACALTIVALLSSFALAGAQHGLEGLSGRPLIAIDAASGDVGLYVRMTRSAWQRVDAEHVPIVASPPTDVASLQFLWSSPAQTIAGGMRFEDPHLYESARHDQVRRRANASDLRAIDVDPDPLAPQVQVVDSTGRVHLDHRFASQTSRERVRAAAIAAFSLLRPPLLQVATHLSVPRHAAITFTQQPWFDPLLAARSRPGLLLANLGVAALAAWLAFRHCVRRGADAVTTRFWIVAGLCFGVLALLAVAAIETRRAHATRRSRPDTTARPLVFCASDHRPS